MKKHMLPLALALTLAVLLCACTGTTAQNSISAQDRYTGHTLTLDAKAQYSPGDFQSFGGCSFTTELTFSQLVQLAQQELQWKKSTTYTVLKRLCSRGLFQNQSGTVSSLLSREEFYARQSEQFVEETFDGSLPAFLAAFTTRKKLSDEEVRQLQQLIEENRKG